MPAHARKAGPTPDLSRDQAFMVDPKAPEWITGQAGLKKTDTVLEIGAGTGNLTLNLAKSGARIVAVESDSSLEPALRKRLKAYRNAEVVIGNGLKVLDSGTVRFNKLVSNIPYAISEPLIRRLIFHDFDLAVLTLPKAFAHRLIAAEWENEYSMVSFVFQRFYVVQACMDLQKDSFDPVPRTNSVAIRFDSKPKDSVFCQMLLRPRMVSRNALREALCSAKGYTKNQARDAVIRLGIKRLLDRKVSELGIDDMKRIVSMAAEFG
jgi:16S rRNA (adenine1518-N6/adenine1519-N6)-dimethyltransferase